MAANVHGSHRTMARNAICVKNLLGTVRLKFKQQNEKKKWDSAKQKKQFLYFKRSGKHFTWLLRPALVKLTCRALL